MSAITVRLPQSVHDTAKSLAARDEVSMNQFIASAVAEKSAAILTVDFLRQEGQKGSRKAFERVMRAVPKT